MERTGYHDLKHRNLVFINGRRIGGWGEEGGIEYEEAGALAEHLSGAGSKVVVSNMNDDRIIATLTVLNHSRSAKILHEEIQAQTLAFRGLGPIPPRPFLHEDVETGDKIADPYCVFLTRLLPSKGRTAGEMSTQILLPVAGDPLLMSIGNLNLVGL